MIHTPPIKGVLYRLVIVLVLTLCLLPVGASSVAALSVNDYFNIVYDIEFSQDIIRDGNPFSATVSGTASCTQDLPLTVSQAVMSGAIVAHH